MTLDEYSAERKEFNHLINAGLRAAREAGKELKEYEKLYRQARREAWSRCPRQGMTAEEKKDWIEAETAEQRAQRDEADYDRRVALAAVSSRRTQLSALQSEMKAYGEEAALVRFGGDSTG